MVIKLKDFHETIGAPPFCKHAGSRLLLNAPNIARASTKTREISRIPCSRSITEDLSPLSDLSRVGARAGMTTGATLSGPSLASWFLDRKLGEGYKYTLDQSDWCLMFLCNQAWISLPRLPEPRANRKTVLKVKCFNEASFKGLKGASVSWRKTRDRF